ncbi:MAG: hypothetical protein FJ405_15860 [Verrucomicrobia bacterium]|nr:hypothetical protein [Verrucomicrobiota bacterium]
MKIAFWILAAATAVVLGVVIVETQRLNQAQQALEESSQLNARVQLTLIAKQKQAIAAAQTSTQR